MKHLIFNITWIFIVWMQLIKNILYTAVSVSIVKQIIYHMHTLHTYDMLFSTTFFLWFWLATRLMYTSNLTAFSFLNNNIMFRHALFTRENFVISVQLKIGYLNRLWSLYNLQRKWVLFTKKVRYSEWVHFVYINPVISQFFK